LKIKNVNIRFFMDCCAISIATTYSIRPLYEVMRVSHRATLYRDVVHVAMNKDGVSCEAFFFSYGVAVFWGATKELARKIVHEDAVAFEQQRLDDVEIDEFTFTYGETAKIFEDEIILPNHDIVTILALSHGIAQSVKLNSFETALKKTFNATKVIPEELAKKGKIPLSRPEIRRKMGQLFIERNSINLYMEVLDTPEFFWEYPELEPLYMMTANYLDIKRRVEILNQRLDVIHGLFEMLGTELNHLHSSRLEWTIISLIVIEVAIALLRDVFGVI